MGIPGANRFDVPVNRATRGSRLLPGCDAGEAGLSGNDRSYRPLFPKWRATPQIWEILGAGLLFQPPSSATRGRLTKSVFRPSRRNACRGKIESDGNSSPEARPRPPSSPPSPAQHPTLRPLHPAGRKAPCPCSEIPTGSDPHDLSGSPLELLLRTWSSSTRHYNKPIGRDPDLWRRIGRRNRASRLMAIHGNR